MIRRLLMSMALLAATASASQAGFSLTLNTDGTTTSGGGANVSTVGGTTVNAQVQISFDSLGKMTAVILNKLSGATKGGREITGVEIFSSPTLTVSSPLLSTYGQLTSKNSTTDRFVQTGSTGLTSNGAFVVGTGTPGAGISYFDGVSNAVAASNWQLTSASGKVSIIGSGKPTQSVVGTAGSDNIAQTPVFLGQVTVLAETNQETLLSFQITKVRFYFGTEANTDYRDATTPGDSGFGGFGDVNPTPAPSALLLGLLGIPAFALLRRRVGGSVAA